MIKDNKHELSNNEKAEIVAMLLSDSVLRDGLPLGCNKCNKKYFLTDVGKLNKFNEMYFEQYKLDDKTIVGYVRIYNVNCNCGNVIQFGEYLENISVEKGYK